MRRPRKSKRRVLIKEGVSACDKTRMSELKAPAAGMLIVAMFIGCSYETTIGKAAQRRTAQQSHAGVIDHVVPHISTERANKGSTSRFPPAWMLND